MKLCFPLLGGKKGLNLFLLSCCILITCDFFFKYGMPKSQTTSSAVMVRVAALNGDVSFIYGQVLCSPIWPLGDLVPEPLPLSACS